MDDRSLIVTDSHKFNEEITKLEESLIRIKSSFEYDKNNLIKLDNNQQVWKSKAQEKYYEKYKELVEVYNPISTSLENIISFLKDTINKYEVFEKTTDSSIEKNNNTFDVN